MLTINLALVSLVRGHNPSDVARVAAALQRQAVRDFGPQWNVTAAVDAFPRLEDVPVGYWPMIVERDIHTPGAAGVHEDRNGQPFALIAMSDSWSLTASHEMLEMLGDPFGRRVIPGRLHGQRHPRFGLHHATVLRPAAVRRLPLQLHRGDQAASRDPARRLHQLA